jgi:hypothetical protein
MENDEESLLSNITIIQGDNIVENRQSENNFSNFCSILEYKKEAYHISNGKE